MVVVLTNLAKVRENIKLEDCVTSAYDVIKSRQGEMINGTFVKSSTIDTTTTNQQLKQQIHYNGRNKK
jgi:hypothetical protein